MTICIVGAGGFVGGHVVLRLLREARAFRCCFRRPIEPMSWPFQSRVADVLNRAALIAALHGAHTVINLSSITRELRSGYFEEFYSKGTKNLVEAASVVGASRIIQLGALSPSRPSQEQSSYLYWKRTAAEIVLNSRVPSTVIEASAVFGDGDQHLSFLAFLVRTCGLLPLPGKDIAAVTTQPVWIGDVVDAIVGAIDEPSVVGATLPLAGPRKYVVRDLFRAVAAECGVQPLEVTIPEWTTGLSFGLWKQVFAYFPLSPALLAAMRLGSESDSHAAYKLLRSRPSELRDRADYLRGIRWKLLADWRARARRGFLWDAIELRARLARSTD
jgi:uncharacterized protein YbjT (DUF2867 family)